MRALGAIALAGLLAAGALGLRPAPGDAADAAPFHDGFALAVSQAGAIRVPDVDYRRTWEHLGTWSVADEEGRGAAGFHQVYTQPGVAEHFRRTGEFPDGAVLVKELSKASSADLTTGHASWATALEGWFVMVKDRRGRFPENPLWGEGWGWAFFGAGDRTQTTTKAYGECLGCHVPAKADDWVYVRAYPALRR